jgi:predicted DNA-binding protein (MmcQ/YjbR family)
MKLSGAAEKIKRVVLTWDQVEAQPHRFGGTEYRIGKRELGHIHGDSLVDIPFPKKIRDEIIAAGEAQPHHILPETGWVSFYLQKEEDVEHAIELLRRSYEIAVKQHAARELPKNST